jgi:hypothetical protein
MLPVLNIRRIELLRRNGVTWARAVVVGLFQTP